MRSLWTQTRTDFEGDHYSISGGVCEPKPPRPGGAEILLAAEKPKMVALAARFADRVNVLARGNTRTAEIARTTRRAADALGRRGDDLVISRMCTVLLTDDPIGTVDERYAAIDRRANQIGMEPSVLRHELDHWIHSYVGPLDGLRQWAHDSTDALGIDEMIICIDTIDTVDYQHTMAGLRLFSSAVINGR